LIGLVTDLGINLHSDWGGVDEGSRE
jgi:hypothetical protein